MENEYLFMIEKMRSNRLPKLIVAETAAKIDLAILFTYAL
ncbi:hypothetical protein CCACVL1_06155 [Corchorus capsularis]|uniref:Uncharacterized protein n=1 Tax=Corchorus capsularis TaxID=210143 RepID=A0A1R3JH10_COCAP|nr:hypothetical protein CCACVL1_06155 [Corchorus capsularis]